MRGTFLHNPKRWDKCDLEECYYAVYSNIITHGGCSGSGIYAYENIDIQDIGAVILDNGNGQEQRQRLPAPTFIGVHTAG